MGTKPTVPGAPKMRASKPSAPASRSGSAGPKKAASGSAGGGPASQARRAGAAEQAKNKEIRTPAKVLPGKARMIQRKSK